MFLATVLAPQIGDVTADGAKETAGKASAGEDGGEAQSFADALTSVSKSESATLASATKGQGAPDLNAAADVAPVEDAILNGVAGEPDARTVLGLGFAAQPSADAKPVPLPDLEAAPEVRTGAALASASGRDVGIPSDWRVRTDQPTLTQGLIDKDGPQSVEVEARSSDAVLRKPAETERERSTGILPDAPAGPSRSDRVVAAGEVVKPAGVGAQGETSAPTTTSPPRVVTDTSARREVSAAIPQDDPPKIVQPDARLTADVRIGPKGDPKAAAPGPTITLPQQEGQIRLGVPRQEGEAPSPLSAPERTPSQGMLPQQPLEAVPLPAQKSQVLQAPIPAGTNKTGPSFDGAPDGQSSKGPGSAPEAIAVPKDSTPLTSSVAEPARQVIRSATGDRDTKREVPVQSTQSGATHTAIAGGPALAVGPAPKAALFVPADGMPAEPMPIEVAPDAAPDVEQARMDVSGRDAVAGQSSASARTETVRPQVVFAQLAEAARTLREGQMEITLVPEELGRVRLTMTPSEAGMAVTILAERPETLDLMRRNIELLARDLAGQGFENLSFSFGGSGAGDAGTEHSRDALVEYIAPAAGTAAETLDPRPAASGGPGLDLRL